MTLLSQSRSLLSLIFPGLMTVASLPAQQPDTSPVKIYVMAGQSNMEGQGELAVGLGGDPNPDFDANTPGTLEYITSNSNDPAGNYDFLVDGNGDFIVRNDVWVFFDNGRRLLNDPTFPINGNLTPGFGPVSPDVIGPELGFGHKMGDLHDNQVLLVKTAWGGRSLYSNFLPPSSRIGQPEPQAPGDPGHDYKRILEGVEEVTSNLPAYFPNYSGQGYEIAGICWHQGWNDKDRLRVEYETNLANLIKDLRRDLGVPDCPFVIATSGMASPKAIEYAQRAMVNVATYPEFEGNVAVIDTRTETYFGFTYEQPVEDSPRAEAFHWNRNARTYLHLGLAMGDAIQTLDQPSCPSRLGAQSDSTSSGLTLSWQNGTETPTSVRIVRDGVEVATAAQVSPATYLDSSLLPGSYDYELQFTIPGSSCPPLALTVNTGITGLTASRSGSQVALSWQNNLSYSAIEIRRDDSLLVPSLSGGATSYTDFDAPVSGVVTYTVQPTSGTSKPAKIVIGGEPDTTGDLTPPSPSTMTWVTPPIAISSSEITMTATSASDENGVEYYFTCTSGGGNDSGWQDSPTYTDQGLTPETLYRYSVQARDLSANTNTNLSSTPDSAVTTLVAGSVEITDTFTFSNDYNPGDTTSDNGGTAKTITIPTGNFSVNGKDKLVGVISTHNSAAINSAIEGLTYGGVDLFPNIIVNTLGFTAQYIFYLDQPAADGDLVISFSSNDNIDEIGVALFALNGTKPGYRKVDSKNGIPVPLYLSTGDFLVGIGQRNNQTQSITNTPTFTALNLSAGNLKAYLGYIVPSSSGPVAPSYATSSIVSSMASFEARTTPSDTIPPTLDPSDIVDDRNGAAVDGDSVTYTLTFSETMNGGTVGVEDFSNAGTASVIISSLTQTTPGVFNLTVTPTSTGFLQLQIPEGATLSDPAGNALDTTAAIVDDTIININSVNQLPSFNNDPVVGAGATEDEPYTGSLAGQASDPEGNPLIFSKLDGPPWLIVATDGSLSGTPDGSDVGINTFTVGVSDGLLTNPVEATLTISVANVNDAPTFTSDPLISNPATEAAAYTGSLAGFANDDDGDVLTFLKVDGPAWLGVSFDGQLSGTPTVLDLGPNRFVVSVTDSIVTTPVEVALDIEVLAASTGEVEVVSTFSFSGDLAQDANFTTTPGSDGGGSDNFGVTKPLVLPVNGFTSAGSDKLVGVLTLHNSAARVSGVTGLTYAGVDVFSNIVIENGTGSGNAFSTQIIFYLDEPTADGDLVIALGNENNVDEAGLALLALNNTGPGFLATGGGGQNPPPVDVSPGDLVIGASHRNNGGTPTVSAPYTQIDLAAGNMKAGAGYLIAINDGPTAPSFDNGQSSVVAAFSAATTNTTPPYLNWATTNAPTTGNDLSADEDGDGVSNGVEFILGGSRLTNDLALTPRLIPGSPGLSFTFNRAQLSIHPSISLTIEMGNDLETWPEVFPVPEIATSTGPLKVIKNSATGFDTVSLVFPIDSALSRYARLKIVVTQ